MTIISATTIPAFPSAFSEIFSVIFATSFLVRLFIRELPLPYDAYRQPRLRNLPYEDIQKHSIPRIFFQLLVFQLCSRSLLATSFSSEHFYVRSAALLISIIMPKVAKPGTSADHQRAYDATALKRVKKLLKAGKSFVGEDDIVLRVRDEHLEALRLLNSGPTAKPTLSAADADSLVANLPTLPRSMYA